MKYFKRYHIFFFSLAFSILLIQNTGYIKEYSFEGSNCDTIPTDTLGIVPVDTTIYPPAITLPQCALCNSSDELLLGHWSFKIDNSYLCGPFTNSGFIGGGLKTSFTFFGPSACSIDNPA